MVSSNDITADWSKGSLDTARLLLARHPVQREKLWDCLVAIEAAIQPGCELNLRELLTGPLVHTLLDSDALMTRTVANNLIFNFRNSSRIGRDFALSRAAAPECVWEPQTTRSVIALAKGRDAVLIGGAYFGDHALFAATALAPGGRCHCFELSDASLDLLRMNIAANGLGNLTVNQKALWSQDGLEIVLEGEDALASPTLAAEPGPGRFITCTIDTYASEIGVGKFDLVMLDIEGGEYEALLGARGLLSQPAETAPALICEIHRAFVDWSVGLRQTPICGLLIEHGYEIFALRDFQGNGPVDSTHVELIDIDSAVLDGPPHGFNLLAVKTRDRLCPDTFRLVRGVSPKLLKHRDPALHAPLNSGQTLTGN